MALRVANPIVAEDGTVLKSHFVRRKDGVIFSYPHPAAESKKNEHRFELRLTEEDRIKRLNAKNATSAKFELDQAQREHNQKMAEQISVMMENNKAMVDSQKELADELSLAKRIGATNVDRQKIIECNTYASGMSKNSVAMTLEEIIYAGYHKFRAELNPYSTINQLRQEYKKLTDNEESRIASIPEVELSEAPEVEPAERAISEDGERMLGEYPMGAVLENMGMEELKSFCKSTFNIQVDEQLGHDVCIAQAIELKNKFYPDKL